MHIHPEITLQEDRGTLTNYVLIFCLDEAGYFIVVEKVKPAWQKGRLNLIGGKVEDGENWRVASQRELLEETGIDCKLNQFEKMGEILLSDGAAVVHCVLARPTGVSSTSTKLAPREGEVEQFYWFHFEDLQQDKRTIPNLLVMVPLFLANCKHWQIEDAPQGTVVSFTHLEA